ncbi:MAG: uncharacterized protein JWN24_3487 [Phycisphaerales bacterium]|nr:uncharacterized protein [Phycisphaerales bacterium]
MRAQQTKLTASAVSSSIGNVIGRSSRARGSQDRNRRRLGKALCRQACRAVAESMEPRRLLSGGSLDSGFGSSGFQANYAGPSPTATALAMQSDGKILQAGCVYNAGTTLSDFALLRSNANGSLDSTFGTGGRVITDFNSNYDNISALAVQSDGKIVVVGTTGWNLLGIGYNNFAVARYNTDGSLDTTFGTGGKAVIDFGNNQSLASSVAIQSDGKIVVAGTTYSGIFASNDFAVARFNSDGTLDSTFGTGGKVATDLGSNDFGNAVAIQSDGKIIVGGASGISVFKEFALARYTSTGALDTTFNSSGIVTTALDGLGQSAISSLAVQSDGKIVAAGERANNAAAVVRYTSAGALDTTFNSTGKVFNTSLSPGASGVAMQADGKVLISGGGTFDGTNSYFNLARYNSDGSADTGFGSSGIAQAQVTGVSGQDSETAMAIESDGKVVVGGTAASGGNWVLGRFTLTAPPTASAGGPYSVNEGSSIALSGAGSTDPDSETLTYQWDLNYNGVTFNPTVTGVSPTFSAAGLQGPASRTIALRVTDLLGAPSTISTAALTIQNVAPTVGAGANQTVNEGATVLLQGTYSDPDPNDTFTFKWHVTANNGQTIADGNAANFSFPAVDEGTYTATFTVTDHAGAATSATTTVTSNHVAPIPVISGLANANRAGAYTLNLSCPEPGIETVSSWNINWGDGSTQTVTGNPSSVTHSYYSAGTVSISATATDADGSYSATALPVTVSAGIYYDLAAAYNTDYASYTASGSSPANAVDANSSTEWVSTPVPYTNGQGLSTTEQWLFADLGGAYNLREVKVNFDSAAYAGTYKIRVSQDTITWVDATATLNGSAGVNDAAGLAVNAHYVMVDMLTPKTGGTYYAVKDFEVYGSDDLALGQQAWSSNVTPDPNAPKAFDATTSTEWVSNSASNAFLFVDLGEVYNISQVKITFDGDYASSYYIRTSSDTTNWSTISPVETGTNGTNIANGFNGNGRYVLVNLTTAANGTDFKVSDFEVNGGVNLTYRMATVVSSPTPINTAGAGAVDGSLSTAWTSGANGTQSIYTDLGATYDVTRVKLTWGSNYASAYQLQVSNTPTVETSWRTISTMAGGTGGVNDGGVSGNGRYVRLRATAGNGSNYSLEEFEVYGTANLALNHTTYTSSYVSGHEGPYAVDDNPLTSWNSSAAGSQWFFVDLGAIFTVTNVTVNFGAAYASNLRIAVSNDGASWSTISTVNYSHAGQNMFAGLSGTGRYLMVWLDATSSSFYQINELSVFGN